MKRQEFESIYKELQQYPNFEGTYIDWYGELIDYPYKGVLKNLKNHKSTNAPLPKQLIGKLEKEEVIEDWITCCDLCGAKIKIHNNDMTEFNKHYRKCQKIDFIDRIVFRYKGQHIASVKYYEMDDEELERNYRQTMDYYLKHRDLNNIFKKIPE